MMTEKQIREAINSIQTIILDESEARVTTQCFYPTNSLVRVAIRGGSNGFVVSDMGGAVKEATGVGLSMRLVDKSIKNIVRNQGLDVNGGEICSPVVSIEGLGPTVALVANASKDVAEWCFATFKIQHSRNFRHMLSELMNAKFGQELKHDFPIIGKSNKRHKFEYALVRNSNTILIDSVTRDAASINSRVVANLDIRQMSNDGIKQYIIYDDHDEWNPPDLMLLQMAAAIVPFSSTSNVLEHLAA